MERLYHQKLRVKIRTSDILKLRSIPSNNYMTTITSTRNLFMIMGKGMIRITIMIKIQGTIKMQVMTKMRLMIRMLPMTKMLFMTKMRLTIRMPHTTKTQLMTKMLPMIKMPYTIIGEVTLSFNQCNIVFLVTELSSFSVEFLIEDFSVPLLSHDG